MVEQAAALEELDPYNTNFKEQIALAKCKGYGGQKRDAEALVACEEAADVAPSDIEPLMVRARILRAQGKWDEAIYEFNKAKQIQPRNGQIHRELGETERQKKVATRKDYYKLLGVPRTASVKQMKKAYKLLAIKYHSDSTKLEDKDEAHRMFIEVGEAWDVLGDEQNRARYDRGESYEDIQKSKQQEQAAQHRGAQQPFGGFGGFHQWGFRGG